MAATAPESTAMMPTVLRAAKAALRDLPSRIPIVEKEGSGSRIASKAASQNSQALNPQPLAPTVAGGASGSAQDSSQNPQLGSKDPSRDPFVVVTSAGNMASPPVDRVSKVDAGAGPEAVAMTPRAREATAPPPEGKETESAARPAALEATPTVVPLPTQSNSTGHEGTANATQAQPAQDPRLPADASRLSFSGPVHAAQLLARLDQSEMHIGLRTASFGSVEVHAVVRDSEVGLAIGSERGQLSHLLAPEMPGIAGKLQQHDLHLIGVRFFDPALSAGTGFSAGTDPRSRPSPPLPLSSTGPPLPPDETPVVAEPALVPAHAGLSIRV